MQQTHFLVRAADEGGWEVRRFTGRESHHPTLEAAVEHAEDLILSSDNLLSTIQIQRWNGITETRIFQEMVYRVDPRTDPVFRASMEFS